MASVQYDGRPSPGALPVAPSHVPEADAATQRAMGWLGSVADGDETSPRP